MLGVLKAGGAYVPLDPVYPRDRLSFMLADSQVSVLVTSEEIRTRLPEHSICTTYLDTDRPVIERQPDTNPPSGATPDDLAYVIFTSGSTGRPKGAMILHRGLSNYLRWCINAYDVASGQGAPVHSSISFDLTVTSLFAPLLVGRRVDLLDEDLGVDQLAAALRDNSGYSLVKITPAHLQLLGRQLAPHDAAGRTRAFVIGGEQLTAEHIAFWQKHAPDTLLFNEYGPTETVVGCCVYRVPSGWPANGVIPIGRPIDNTQLYVLDDNLNPLPDEAMGELYIGGAGVARGYLNQPELTARKFIGDPFGPEPGARLYRTGDLCRRRRDGELEYMGRVDHQVKIRGHRIELGEIEAVLLQHPAVREAVAVAREDSAGVRQLVSYVVTDRDRPAPSLTQFQDFLRKTLPEPMIPAVVMVLDALPLSITGKVDRSALPAPERSCHDVGLTVIEPSSDCERRLRSVWEEVLGVKPIGVEDDFIKLGGDSLIATVLLVRIEKEFGKSISPSILLRGGSIRQLARLLVGEAPPRQESLTVQLREGSGRPLFILPGIGGCPEELIHLASHLNAGRPIYSFRSPGQDGMSELIDGIELLAMHYLEMLRSVQPKGPYQVLGYSFGGTIAFEMALQLHAVGERVDYLAILDKDAPREFIRPWLNPAYTASVAYKFVRWAIAGFFRSAGRKEHAATIALSVSTFLRVWKENLSRLLGLATKGSIISSEVTQAAALPTPLSRLIAVNLRAEMRYRPRIYSGRVLLYRVRSEPPRFRATRLDMGWGRFVQQDVDVRFLQGNHLTFHKDPGARLLAERIEADLAMIVQRNGDAASSIALRLTELQGSR